MIRWLVLRLAAVRWLLKLGGLAFLIPIAFLLKAIGLPLLAILSIVALPVLCLLFLFGLPVFLVVIAGGAIVGLIGMVLSLAFAALKVGLFVVLPIFLIWKLVSMLFRRGGDCTPGGGDASSAPPPAPDAPASDI